MGIKSLYHVILTVGFGCMSNLVFGQNLIRNPSFESFVHCPMKLGNLEKDVKDWQVPTLGSTDYFNGCSQAMGTPKNFNGEQPANFGIGYVGFYMLAPGDYREYLQAQLIGTLKKGEHYTVSFYVSLAERSDFAVKEFGIRFSEYPIKVETTKVLSAMHLSKLQGDTSNYVEIKYSKFYSDEKEWILLTQEFVANGTENYMIIGNFKDNKRTQRFQTQRRINKGSYYYLDMVSLHPTGSEKMNTSLAITDFELDSIHVFKDVLFNFNTSKLKRSNQKELQEVVLFLEKNPSIQIKISGHTDAIGSNNFNQKLSLNRAKTVAAYFMQNGISERRIQYEGFGSERPVATNKTKAGRLLNRRVEFVLVE
ncbi:OmpA family protein [Maribacter sp. X9]|uniref:OmpA family protein n=1 Tax=Maribacter sp. X9 TaxID=3402159 RepID=UPI003AF33D43